MTDLIATSAGQRATFLCGKSWTAYVSTFVIAVLLFFAALPLAFKYNTRAALVVLIGSALIVGYRGLGVDYTHGGYVYDVVQQGPIAGLKVHF